MGGKYTMFNIQVTDLTCYEFDNAKWSNIDLVSETGIATGSTITSIPEDSSLELF